MASWKTIIADPPIDTDEYLLVAAKTIKDLGWDIHFVSEHGLVAGVPLSLRRNSWGETFTLWLDGRSVHLESKSNALMIASKKNRNNVEDFLEHFEAAQISLKADEKQDLQQWIYENKRSGADDLLDPLSSKYRDPNIKERWYLPRGEFLVTGTLIAICVLVFVLMVVSGVSIFAPTVDELLKWGANVRIFTIAKGEWWRIFTCIFEHIGIFHLLLNMFSLYMIGSILEPLIGKWRYLTAFFVTGVGGSIASLIWNPNVASAGASGAIFGLFGVLLALLLTNLIEKSIRNSILPNILSIVVINLVVGFRPGVDYAAHIGGLATGMILGYLYFYMIRRTKHPVRFSLIGAVLIGAAVTVGGLTSMQNIDMEFERIVEEASKYEAEGIKVFDEMKADAGDAVVERILVEETIPAWQAYQKEINKLDALKLPPRLIRKKDYLKEYAETRLKYFNLLEKSIREGLDENLEQLKSYDHRLSEIIEALQKAR